MKSILIGSVGTSKKMFPKGKQRDIPKNEKHKQDLKICETSTGYYLCVISNCCTESSHGHYSVVSTG